MRVTQIGDGLWRWVVAHPGWTPECDRPDGWGRLVASVYYEAPDAVVLIDPLVPEDGTDDVQRFWAALDRDVERLARPVVVLVGSVDHGRSADTIASRYLARGRRVAVVGAAAIRANVSCRLTATIEDGGLPAGVEAHPIGGMSPGEAAFVLGTDRAVVFADAVIGAGAGMLRLAPVTWGVRTPEGRATYARAFRPAIAALAGLDPEIVLPSHGEPVLSGGAAALRVALSAPCWGD